MAPAATTSHASRRPRPRRLAQSRGVFAPRPHAGYTLAEYAQRQQIGALNHRVSWLIYQVGDNDWLVSHGRDRQEHVLQQKTLMPRRFKSPLEAMNQLRQWLCITTYTVEALEDARIVPQQKSGRVADSSPPSTIKA